MGEFVRGVEQAITRNEPSGRADANRRTPQEPPRFTQVDQHTGELVTGTCANDATPDWAAIFAHWGLSPDEWVVDEATLRVNAWEGPTAGGEATIYRQYKAAIRRRTTSDVDVVDLLKQVKRWKPRRKPVTDEPGSCFVVVATDWQIGGEGGSAAAAERLLDVLDDIEARAKHAVKHGATHLLIPALGDLVEGVFGQYPAQPFTVDLDLSGQVRVARRILLAWLKRLVPLFQHITVVGIPGNHGRRNQKVDTTFEDNADVDVVEGLAEVCAESEWGAHIEFVIPRDTLVSLVPICGTNVLLAHGDQQRGSADKLRNWWREVSFTRWGDADLGDVLVVGHRHHLRVEEVASGRWLFQCPAMDGGSRWYAEIGGATSQPGVLTFTTRDSRWWDLHVCQPAQ